MTDEGYFSRSPFKQWLGTNHVLSDLEKAQLHAFLHEPMQQAAYLDRKIQELITSRNRLKASIESHKDLGHPIRRLPNEILQCIFLESLPTRHFPTMDPLESPLVLTQVCRAWREVALSTPQLWSSIHIVALPDTESSAQEVIFHVGRIKRWLRAAHPMQLSISVASDIDYSPYEPAQVTFKEAILAFSPRIRVLKLKVSSGLLEVLSGHMDWPVLEKVVVDMDDTPDGQPYGPGLETDEIWQAPKLKSVEWKTIDSNFYEMPLKWGQMEKISLSSTGIHPEIATASGSPPFILRAMLHETLNLRTLRIAVSGEEDGSEAVWGKYFRGSVSDFVSTSRSGSPSRASSPSTIPPTPIADPVKLDHLATLDLRDTWVDPALGKTVTKLLHNAYFPELTSLAYDLRYEYAPGVYSGVPPKDEHPLVNFMRAQSQPTAITRFTITVTSICRDGFLECLKLMPMLEQLRLKEGAMIDVADLAFAYDNELSQEDFDHFLPDDDFLKSLCVPQPIDGHTEGKKAILCPRLHSLRCDVGDFSVEDFHAFLETRLGLAKASSFGALSHSEGSNSTTGYGVVPMRRYYLRALDLRASSNITRNEAGPGGSGLEEEEAQIPFGCKGRGMCTLGDDVEVYKVDAGYDVIRGRKDLEGFVDHMRGDTTSVLANLDMRSGIRSSSGDDEWA